MIDSLGLATRKWVEEYVGPGMGIYEGGLRYSGLEGLFLQVGRKVLRHCKVQREAATLEENAQIPSIAVARTVSVR